MTFTRRKFLGTTLGAGVALAAGGCALTQPATGKRTIVDAQVHLWKANTPDWPWVAGTRPQLPEPFTIERALALMDEAGVDRVVVLPPTLSPNNDYALEAARRHPGLPLMMDHMGLNSVLAREGRAAEVIAEAVALARYPNVSVKMTNLVNASREGYPYRDLNEHLRRVFDAYGPQRCHWGTDITAAFAKATWRQRITHVTEELTFLSEPDKDWLMGRSIRARLNWA